MRYTSLLFVPLIVMVPLAWTLSAAAQGTIPRQQPTAAPSLLTSPPSAPAVEPLEPPSVQKQREVQGESKHLKQKQTYKAPAKSDTASGVSAPDDGRRPEPFVAGVSSYPGDSTKTSTTTKKGNRVLGKSGAGTQAPSSLGTPAAQPPVASLPPLPPALPYDPAHPEVIPGVSTSGTSLSQDTVVARIPASSSPVSGLNSPQTGDRNEISGFVQDSFGLPPRSTSSPQPLTTFGVLPSPSSKPHRSVETASPAVPQTSVRPLSSGKPPFPSSTGETSAQNLQQPPQTEHTSASPSFFGQLSHDVKQLGSGLKNAFQKLLPGN